MTGWSSTIRVLALTCVLAALLPCGETAADFIYTVTDLGSLGGSTQPRGINSQGVVTGDSRKTIGMSAEDRAFVASGGAITDLGALPNGNMSSGRDINSNGVIVGFSETTDSGGTTTHAFKYENGVMVDLHTLGNGGGTRRRSFAYGVNDAGTVVGNSEMSAGSSERAFKYENGSMSLLNQLSGLGETRAWDINNSGVIVGDGQDRAVRWDANGTIHDLGTLPGGLQSHAEAISDTGIIVGDSRFSASSDVHAFMYMNNSMTDLGTLGGNRSFANGVDDFGNVVGSSEMVPGSTSVIHAFLYSGTTMFDLNDLIAPGSGWVLASAEDINSAGQIIGIGSLTGFSETRGFLLTPVSTPEPSTLTLCGTTFLLAGGCRAWQKARARRRKPSCVRGQTTLT